VHGFLGVGVEHTEETPMKLSIIKTTMTAIALTTFVAEPIAAEGEHVAPMKQLAGSKVAGWAASPVVIAAINAQNTKHASLAQGDVDKMDKTWRAEVKSGGGATTKSVLGNELSGYLKKVKGDSKGLYTEIFVLAEVFGYSKSWARAARIAPDMPALCA
jgi:hypothetical protein